MYLVLFQGGQLVGNHSKPDQKLLFFPHVDHIADPSVNTSHWSFYDLLITLHHVLNTLDNRKDQVKEHRVIITRSVGKPSPVDMKCHVFSTHSEPQFAPWVLEWLPAATRLNVWDDQSQRGIHNVFVFFKQNPQKILSHPVINLLQQAADFCKQLPETSCALPAQHRTAKSVSGWERSRRMF